MKQKKDDTAATTETMAKETVEKMIFSTADAAEALSVNRTTLWKLGKSCAAFRAGASNACRGSRYHRDQLAVCARVLAGAITMDEADAEWSAWLTRGGDPARRLGDPARRRKAR